MTGENKSRSAKLRSVPKPAGEPQATAPSSLESLTAPDLRVVEDRTSASTRMRRLAALQISQTAKISLPRGKRVFDVVAASLLGLLFLPAIVVIVLTIRLGGTPVLFRHRRVGRHGRAFHCLKFRTMIPNAEQVLRKLLDEHPEIRDEWTENHKLRHDPRITLIGRFLRFTSLDELPQLWNVIRGDMSLVGPRPIVRAELLRYGREVALYLAVKPGLTGLWQVKGRSDTTYRRRVAMDKYYVMHQNLLLDLYIVAATAGAVIRRAGAY